MSQAREPRVVVFANNRLGLRALEAVRASGSPVVGLVVHPTARARHRDEIAAASGLPAGAVREGPDLETPPGMAWLRGLAPTHGLSAAFGYRLRPEVLQCFSHAALNLHTSLLPHGRGANPNVWAIVERTPAGATLHHMDADLDTGDIVAQQEVTVRPEDTGGSLFARLEDAAVELLIRTWPAVLRGEAPRRPQPVGGRTHRTRDLEALDAIDLDATCTARELLDILRARTFPPHAGAHVTVDGRRIHLELRLRPADEPATDGEGG